MDRPEELNLRILERNNLSNNQNILFTPRSISTKYTLPESINNINKFNNNLKIGNYNDYSDKINHESELRNQLYPLENNSENQYIPDKNSDLYNYEINNTTNTIPQLFTNLFENNTFSNSSTDINNLQNRGTLYNNLFNNDTRQQLKDN
jgi:hypothetical protein